MASGKDGFLFEDDLNPVLAIIDADMFENDKDMKSEIVICIKNLPSRENCSFKFQFVRKFVYPKQVYQGTSKVNIKSILPLIVPAIVILVV